MIQITNKFNSSSYINNNNNKIYINYKTNSKPCSTLKEMIKSYPNSAHYQMIKNKFYKNSLKKEFKRGKRLYYMERNSYLNHK
jgi:hypothetical protein